MNSGASVAYDYYRFEERDRAEIKAIAKQPKQKKGLSVVKAVCYMMVAVTMLSALIYTRVVQAELNSEYETTVSALNLQKGENSRLTIELEQKLSRSNVEESARAMEMGEMQQYQIEYVHFNTENKVEVIEEKNFLEKAVDWVKGLFN